MESGVGGRFVGELRNSAGEFRSKKSALRPAVHGQPSQCGRFDRAGVTVSSLCLGHCLLIPVLLWPLPFAGLDAHSLLFFAAGVAVLGSVFGGTVSGQGFRSEILFGAGLAALIVSLLVESAWPLWSSPLGVLGASLLIAGHVWRLQPWGLSPMRG